MSAETPYPRGFGSYRARQSRKEFNARRRLKRWRARPLSDEEEKIFRDIQSWIDLGASLSAAVMNADLTESQFAGLVHEMESGRNSSFEATLKSLLAVPWHFKNEATPRDVRYLRDSNLTERQMVDALWSD